MFILRFFTTLLALLGYILAGTLVYVAFFPLKAKAANVLSLNSIYECDETVIFENKTDFTTQELTRIREVVGDNSSIEIFNNLAQNINNITHSAGTEIRLNASYCTIADNAETIQVAEGYFGNMPKSYSYGSVKKVVETINNIPYIELLNVDTSTPSVLVRTKQCSAAIHRSNVYFIAPVGNKNILMARVDLVDATGSSGGEKILKNLVDSGHYLKYKLDKCNG